MYKKEKSVNVLFFQTRVFLVIHPRIALGLGFVEEG